MVSLFGPPTAPADCVLAFAIPTTEAEVIRDLGLGPTKDFAAHVTGREPAVTDAERAKLYRKSNFPTAFQELDRIVGVVEGYQIRVVRGLVFAGLRALLDEYPVITLVTHTAERGGQVEFADGLYPIEDAARVVPIRPGAVLDLSICRSVDLADAIKRDHPEWEVRSNAKPINLVPQLRVYEEKVRLMARRPIHYLDADFAVRLAFRQLRESRR